MWTLVLLTLMLYMVAVCFTELVLDKRRQAARTGVTDDDIEALSYWCGNVPRTMLLLYESISGGNNWDEFITPLINAESPLYGLLFLFFHCFILFAMLNVIT